MPTWPWKKHYLVLHCLALLHFPGRCLALQELLALVTTLKQLHLALQLAHLSHAGPVLLISHEVRVVPIRVLAASHPNLHTGMQSQRKLDTKDSEAVHQLRGFCAIVLITHSAEIPLRICWLCVFGQLEWQSLLECSLRCQTLTHPR